MANSDCKAHASKLPDHRLFNTTMLAAGLAIARKTVCKRARSSTVCATRQHLAERGNAVDTVLSTAAPTLMVGGETAAASSLTKTGHDVEHATGVLDPPAGSTTTTTVTATANAMLVAASVPGSAAVASSGTLARKRRCAGIATRSRRATTANVQEEYTDMIWGPVSFPRCIWEVIDTQAFQRLRGLMQTGMLYQVFPSSVHTRFAHSLGVAWLAWRVMTNLSRCQPELGITEDETLTVMLAGLCHDLGHGPCSHAFEHLMHHIDPSWSHEQQSVTMLRYIFTLPHMATSSLQPLVHAACELILGSAAMAPADWAWRGPQPGREFMFELISNARSGLDLDKIDYLKRDSATLGISIQLSPDVLLNHCRVVAVASPAPVQHCLAWPKHDAAHVMAVFAARHTLHAAAYQHAAARRYEMMAMLGLRHMVDTPLLPAVLLGEPAFASFAGTASQKLSIRQAVRNPAVYARLTDYVVSAALQGMYDDVISAQARALFARIRSRDLWPVVAEVTVKNTLTVKEAWDVALAAPWLQDGMTAGLLTPDMAVYSYGKARADPMRFVRFYEETPQRASITRTARCKLDDATHCMQHEAHVSTDHEHGMHENCAVAAQAGIVIAGNIGKDDLVAVVKEKLRRHGSRDYGDEDTLRDDPTGDVDHAHHVQQSRDQGCDPRTDVDSGAAVTTEAVLSDAAGEAAFSARVSTIDMGMEVAALCVGRHDVVRITSADPGVGGTRDGEMLQPTDHADQDATVADTTKATLQRGVKKALRQKKTVGRHTEHTPHSLADSKTMSTAQLRLATQVHDYSRPTHFQRIVLRVYHCGDAEKLDLTTCRRAVGSWAHAVHWVMQP